MFRLLDARFGGALKDTTLDRGGRGPAGRLLPDQHRALARSGGGDVYFDEFAKVYRVTAFYNVKVNL